MQGDGCGKGGMDLTSHACLPCCCSISASKFGNRCDPCLQPTRSTPPKSRDPPRSFVRASCSARRHATTILAPHSTVTIRPNDLSSHVLGPTFVTDHRPRHKHAGHSQLGLVFASRATLCSATGQRRSILSTNWPIRPEYHSSRLVPAAGSGRPPASVGPGWLHQLDEGQFIRRAFHIAVLRWFTTEQLNGCSRSKDRCSLIARLPTSM